MSLAVSGDNGFEVRVKFLWLWGCMLLLTWHCLSLRLNGKGLYQFDLSSTPQSLTSYFTILQNRATLHFPI